MAKKKKAPAAAKRGAKKPAKKAAKKTAPKAPAAKQARVFLPSAVDYPNYKLIFEGKDGAQKICEGPHTESLTITTPDVNLELTVENQQTSKGPILKISIVHG